MTEANQPTAEALEAAGRLVAGYNPEMDIAEDVALKIAHLLTGQNFTRTNCFGEKITNGEALTTD